MTLNPIPPLNPFAFRVPTTTQGLRGFSPGNGDFAKGQQRRQTAGAQEARETRDSPKTVPVL
jgi:hypothetical protein